MHCLWPRCHQYLWGHWCISENMAAISQSTLSNYETRLTEADRNEIWGACLTLTDSLGPRGLWEIGKNSATRWCYRILHLVYHVVFHTYTQYLYHMLDLLILNSFVSRTTAINQTIRKIFDIIWPKWTWGYISSMRYRVQTKHGVCYENRNLRLPAQFWHSAT